MRRLLERMGRRAGLGALAWALLASALPGAPARAQDWGLTRERPRPKPGPGRRRPGARAAGQRSGGAESRTELLIRRYRRILARDPAESFAFERLLDLYRERDGNIDALVTELEEDARDDEEAYAPRMLLGHIHRARNEPEKAREAYEEAASLRPKEPGPRLAMARIDRDEGRLSSARSLLEEAVERTPEATERRALLRDLGEIALEQEDWDAARSVYDRLARDAQSSVYVRTEYARALAERDEHERAIKEYERILRDLRGDNRVLPPVLRDMGRAQLAAGDADAAIQTLERALRLAGPRSGVRQEVYDVLVEAYRRGDRLAELVQKLEREGRRSFEALQLEARLHDELGHEEEALEAYRRALSVNPRHIDTRLRLVQLLSRSGEIEQVISEYRKLIRMVPREPRFVVELAQLLMQVGKRDEALRLAARTSRRYPREPSVHRELAELYQRWGEAEKATAEVRHLVKIEPQDPAHLIALGAQQLAEGQADQALATWQRLLRVSPDKAEAYATLGGVLADHDMLQEAEDAYREAVRRDSDELAYVRGLAGVLERPRAGESERAPQARARETEALKLWRRVLDLAAEDRVARREARRRIVGIWARRRELSGRMQRWRRAFQDEPPDVDAGRFLAEAYLRSRPRRLERAETVLERVVELDPGDVESLLALERARTARGDLVGAIAALQRLVDADPRRAPRYLQRMAEHSLALYRDEQAVEFAERAVKRTPDDASAHRRLGDLYRARQDMEEAIASYRRALELNDHLFSTYFDLAELHMARGEREEADRLFRTVVRTSPDDDLVSRAARASIQIHLGEGTLEALERDLLPLALGHPRRPIFRKLLVELYDALTKPWIRAVRGDAETSDEAREQLDRLGGRAIKPLLEALADSDPAQQRVAVDVLAHVGNEHAAGPLLAAAEESGEAGLRTEALVAAGAIAGPDKVERFVELARGTDRTLRGVATWALGRIGGRRAVRALRALVAADDPAVRAFAALGLGHVSDRPSAESLERLAREDRSVQVRAAAAWALGRAGDARHVPSLIAMMRGGDGLLAAAAASALGALGDRRAVETLARALFDPDPEQRASGARAIRRLARPGASQPAGFPLPRHSAAPDAYLRDLLELEASGEPAIELASLRGALEQAARDAFEGPVERATTALTVLTGPGRFTVTPLVGDLDAWPEPARAEAHETLARLGRSLLPSLADLLDHPDAAVREHAIRAVSFVEGAAATRALGASLDDAHPPVQRAALRALASRGTAEDEAVVRRIVDLALEHPDWSTRMRAVEALAPQEVALVVEPLEEALATDPYAFVREAAARALGNYRAKAAPALRRAANSDVEARVRAAARAALEGGSAPVPHAERAGGSGEAATGP